MKITTWSYQTNVKEESFDVLAATKATATWARRRNFPIRITAVTERTVSVELQAPTNSHHNRSVDALGKILTKQLERQSWERERAKLMYAE
jgi:hypothetical protein